MTATTYANGGGPVELATAVIASGDSLSAAIRSGVRLALAVVLPAAMTGTVLTFAASFDDVSWFPVRKTDGSELSVPFNASSYQLIPELFPCKSFKIRSGTAAAPTTELGDRTIIVYLRPMDG